MPTDPTKPHCPVCEEPGRLRKDGTMQQHDAVSGSRICGGTGQDPEPAPEAEAVDPREWAVLDGLLAGQDGDEQR